MEQGKTVLFATNVLDEAWTVSDRVALLNAGKLLALDTPTAIRERVLPVARYRIACHPIDDGLIERVLESGRCVVVPDNEGLVLDIEPDPSILTSVLQAIVSNGVRVSSISREDPPATAFFIKDVPANG
jgi:ABC-2 type transport system ATP-binding protein